MLHQEGHGDALVQETKLALGSIRGGWVHEDPTVLEGAVNVGHHGPNVTGTSLLGLLALYKLFDCWIPEVGITFIKTVDLPLILHSHVGIRQHKLSNTRIQHEAINTVPCG